MDKIELFKNLTVCKQITDIKLNCSLETIYLCAKNEFLVLHNSSWNYLNVWN